jgi:hypothetical protein
MKKNASLILLLLFPAICPAQNPGRKITMRELDGKYWIGQDASDKDVLVRKFAALNVIQIDFENVPPELAQTIDNVRPVDARIFPNLGAHRAEMDAFYSDAANLRIPVWRAFDYVALKRSGASESVLAEYLANARKTLK